MGGMDAKSLHIFRAGRQTAMSGESFDFSENDLAACAAAYDPAVHEAPIVVGHPAADAPAYGWIKGLAAVDGGLDAVPHQVDPAFAELVEAGRFKKISASFYLPDSSSNPKPGALYLRHVGFLGAQPPAVKGLRAPQFAENEAGVVEFGDWAGETNAGLWRRLREWLLVKFGQETADEVVPDWNIETLRDAARAPDPEPTPAAFAEESSRLSTQENPMTPEQIAALEAENARLKQELASFAEEKAKLARAAKHAEHLAYAEQLIGDGRLAPKHKEAVATLLDFACSDAAVEFGEGAAAPLSASFKAFLDDLPKVIEFGEHATKDKAPGAKGDAAAAEFAEKNVDPDRLALHVKAAALAADKGIDYAAAVRQLI